MSDRKNPLRDLTPTEGDLDKNSSSPPTSGETLRERAAKKLQGPNANPSQLGDPVSLKAETSNKNPKPEEAGATASSSQSAPPSNSRGNKAGGETLREKATKKLHGPDANPSQLGDPISLKAEATEHVPAPSEEGASKNKAGRSRL